MDDEGIACQIVRTVRNCSQYRVWPTLSSVCLVRQSRLLSLMHVFYYHSPFIILKQCKIAKHLCLSVLLLFSFFVCFSPWKWTFKDWLWGSIEYEAKEREKEERERGKKEEGGCCFSMLNWLMQANYTPSKTNCGSRMILLLITTITTSSPLLL